MSAPVTELQAYAALAGIQQEITCTPASNEYRMVHVAPLHNDAGGWAYRIRVYYSSSPDAPIVEPLCSEFKYAGRHAALYAGHLAATGVWAGLGLRGLKHAGKDQDAMLYAQLIPTRLERRIVSMLHEKPTSCVEITSEQAQAAADHLGLNVKLVEGLEMWRTAMTIELEHGTELEAKSSGRTDVTHDDLVQTARIALAHVLEYPDYYSRLMKLEQEAAAYWKDRPMPDIFKHV